MKPIAGAWKRDQSVLVKSILTQSVLSKALLDRGILSENVLRQSVAVAGRRSNRWILTLPSIQVVLLLQLLDQG